jgi:diguanylate cyclase (GGDEF)-like protein
MRLTKHPASTGSGVPPHPQLRRGTALALVIGALALVFVLDRSTGLSPVQHLYYVPVIVASIRFGYAGSVTAFLAAILLYHLANPHVLTFRYEESDLVQMALFVAVGITSAKLARDSRRLHRLAITDDLTGLHNLRSFEARLRRLVRGSRQEAAPLALLVVDLDRLKDLNDVHGHLAGAEAVRTVGDLIATHVPPGAVACRYGGDEFVIGVPRCTASQAREIADDLRRAVNASAPVLAGIAFPAGTLSVSVGIAARTVEPRAASADWAADEAAGEELFRAADTALYAAKRSGRNRVAVADSPTTSRTVIH